MKKRYYLAYGSNLNIEQMQWRCPEARIVGTAELRGYELLFKGSKTGSYLTIEKKRGSSVPVGVWAVTENDEKALDRYEGFPDFYYKKDISITYKGVVSRKKYKVDAFVYIMHEDRPYGLPMHSYVACCLHGYRSFGFDEKALFKAIEVSRERSNEDRETVTDLPGMRTTI